MIHFRNLSSDHLYKKVKINMYYNFASCYIYGCDTWFITTREEDTADIWQESAEETT
jgi:hypothetical protein